MQMSEFGAKKRILEVVEQLPDDATIEDAIERLYFLAKIEKGIREADAGLTVPHDEAKKRLSEDSRRITKAQRDGGIERRSGKRRAYPSYTN